MCRQLYSPLFASMVFSLGAITCFGQAEPALTPEAVQFFETKIRPVLVDQCYRCHSTDGQSVRGGLSVDHRDALLAGGESGPAIVPGNLEDSTLWNAINYKDYRMPPKNPLPNAVIDDFRKWIEMGAPDPRVKTGVVVHSKVTPEDIEKGKEFWSFQKPKAQSASAGKYASWAVSNIDRLVASKWESHDVQPAADADPNDLLRRIYFDLIGLPPSLDERDAFLSSYATGAESAIAKVVDQLLERPQFGERWGRHWLDVARYAETTGKEVELTFPHAWRYRDYVIDSFNADKPYDQFIREQIAGDLLPVKEDNAWTEHLIATGFLALGPKSLAEQNPRQFQADLIDEQIDVTTRVFLGISVACARCHDHKFDPIPQSDYYAMAGIFQSTDTFFGGNRSLRNRQPSNLIVLPIDDTPSSDKGISKAELADLKNQLKDAQNKLVEARRAQRNPSLAKDSGKRPSFLNLAILDQVVAQLTNRINSFDSDGKPISMCMGVQEASQPRSARLLVRGEIDQPAQEVQRGLVQVLSNQSISIPSRSSGRLELAKWISSKENPLTSRVMVNRIWQHLIGHAIVRETDNFGFSGPAPTHPELLDHLALEFMDKNWGVKHMIRTIMTSRVYRLSSRFNQDLFEADPDNAWIARGTIKRLDGEGMRDSMLAIGGQIDLKRPRASVIASFGQVTMGPNGPIAIPPMALEMLKDGEPSPQKIGALRGTLRNAASNPLEAPSYHRSIYLPIARNTLPRALDVFDFAEPSLVVGQRESSNTPDQALFMLNNPLVLEQSDALARRLIKGFKSSNERIANAFKLVYGRDATADEIAVASEFFKRSGGSTKSASQDEKAFQTLSQFCQALFCSAEFRFIN